MTFIDRSALSWRSTVFSLAFILLASTAAADRSPSMAIVFEERQLTVTGVTPGHRIVALGLGIGSHGHARLLTRHVEALPDDDLDGHVTFRPHSLPAGSVWVAVDYETGDYVVATPTGEEPRLLALADEPWGASRDRVGVSRADLEVLVVRPGVGAWNLWVADGGSRDSDHAMNGVSRLRLDAMNRLVGTEPKGPPIAIPRDLLVVMDPHTLELFVSEAR